VTEAAAHVDGVIHLAAVLGTAETIDNPRPAAHTNVLGTLNVFEAALQYDLPLVYAAVGNAWMRSEGGGTYVITKSCAEDFVKMFNQHRGARFVAVRPMNAYGPQQSVAAPFGWSKVRKITPAFVCRALSGMPVEVYGDGTQVSDMVYVEDVAATFVHCLGLAEKRQVPEFTVECGPSVSCSVNEVAETIIAEAAKVTGREVPIAHLPMRPGEVPNAVVKADVTTMEKVGIAHDFFVPVEVGMERTVRWFAENEGTHWTRPPEA
jgi:UDP-glucose 4-epimerase